MAVVASQTTNPLVLLIVLGVVAVVVTAQWSGESGTVRLRGLILTAIVVIGIRVFFRILLGNGSGQTIIFTLPQIPLPEQARGISIGGPVHLEGVMAALYDGLRLASLLICVAAGSLLADPRRLLRSAPAALYEAGTAIIISLTVTPQLLDATNRVRQARRLRGTPEKGLRGMQSLLIPVLEDALDSSLDTAAAMDVRGHGRTSANSAVAPWLTTGVTLTGLVGVCVGVYGVLDNTTPPVIGAPALIFGLVLALIGTVISGRRDKRTTYRSQRWKLRDWLTAGVAVAAAVTAVVFARTHITELFPLTNPLAWPVLPPVLTVAIVAAALPAYWSPNVPDRTTKAGPS